MRIVDVNEFYSPTGGGVRTYIDRKMRGSYLEPNVRLWKLALTELWITLLKKV